MDLHVIDHTHWDREWHKTYQEFRVRLIEFMDELMCVLETEEEYGTFMLDGQTSLLEDYLEVKPEGATRLKELISKGKLRVGPWYVQPDTFIPSGEGLVRNLLVSQLIGDRFGGQMKVGYLPDSFGFSSQIPQILAGFEIDSALMYRGVSRDDVSNLEFEWCAPDGSSVLTSTMPLGYGNAMYLSGDLEKDKEEIAKNIDQLADNAPTSNLLLLCGADQDTVRQDLPEIIADLNDHYQGQNINLKMSSLREYIDSVKAEASELESYQGEFRKAEFGRVHGSIEGTRMDIKQDNFQAQNLYEKYVEPMSSLAYLAGEDYGNEIINKGWKYQIENQAHDSICSVCTDEIHSEVKQRYKWAEQIGQTILTDKLAYLLDRIDFNDQLGKPLVVFNSLAQERTDIVEATVYVEDDQFRLEDQTGQEIPYQILSKEEVNLADTGVDVFSKAEDKYYQKIELNFVADFSGYGYKTYYINQAALPSQQSENIAADNILENDYLQVEVKTDGSLKVTDKDCGVEYERLNIFEESGNAGDEYDYSPPKNDEVITTESEPAHWEVIENGPLRGTICITHKLDCPVTTTQEGRADEYKTCKIESYVTLYKQIDRIEVRTVIDNHIKNHRIRALFDPEVRSENHIADNQFGAIERDNYFPETETWEEKGWHEKYYPIFPQQAYVEVSDDEYGLAVLNRGLPQYEILDQEQPKLALTLLSGVDYLGKRDLVNRPGRRSGVHVPTPDAQLNGKFEVEYAIKPHQGDYKAGDVPAAANSYTAPLYATVEESTDEYVSPLEGAADLTTSLPDTCQLLKVNQGRVATSAIKKAEREAAIIWRIYNPLAEKQTNIELEFAPDFFKSIEKVNLNEKLIADCKLEVEGNKIFLPELKSNQIINLKLEL